MTDMKEYGVTFGSYKDFIMVRANSFKVHLVGGKMTATFYELKKKLFYTDEVMVAAVDNVTSVVELK